MLVSSGDAHSTEEEAVFISGVAGGQVVEVEYAYPENCEVGTDAQVGYDNNREDLCVCVCVCVCVVCECVSVWCVCV